MKITLAQDEKSHIFLFELWGDVCKCATHPVPRLQASNNSGKEAVCFLVGIKKDGKSLATRFREISIQGVSFSIKRIAAFACVFALLSTFVLAQDMIQDFETAPLGPGTLFREASFSGSTSANIATTPVPATEVVNTDAYAGAQSLHAIFGWVSPTDPARWCRFTTYNMTTTPNPIIEYDKAVSMWIKVVQGSFTLEILSRDNNAAGAIGADGGASGEIERITPATPVELDSAVNNSWQKIYLSIPGATISAFTGNGVLDNPRGTLDALRIQGTGTTDIIEFYIDDVQQELSAVEDWLLF